MINELNPYTPGAGRKPSYLAGRDSIIHNAEINLKSVLSRFPRPPVAYFGLRGVGKTVLLNEIENIAENLDILYEHIEIGENDKFVRDISLASQKFISQLSLKHNVQGKITKVIEVLKRISISWNFEESTMSVQLAELKIPPSLSNDLTDLFVALGRVAEDSSTAICFFIDEIQYISNEQAEALLMALHRVGQLKLPVTLFCAGLPKIRKTFGELKTYTERLFSYVQVDSLSEEDARDAITKPAKEFNVTYQDDAMHEILKETMGYPYFIQELCSVIWDTQSVSNVITVENVKNSIPQTNKNLDDGFFTVRYDRCTPKEKDFMTAMVKCGDLPCTISNVALNLNSSVKSISPIRAQLISKGLIYPTGYAEIDFTVPKFDKFILRINPELKIG